MSEWKNYSPKDVYRLITNDISDSVHRYFAPVVGMIHGFGQTIGSAATPPQRETDAQKADRIAGG